MTRGGDTIVKSHLVMAQGHSVSVVCTAMPTAMLAGAAPSAVALSCAVGRLSGMVLAIPSAIPAGFQSWIGRTGSHKTRLGRARASVVINVVVGLAFGIILAFAVPWAVTFVFGDAIPVSLMMSGLGGAVIAVIYASRALGLVLIAVDRPNQVTWAIVGAAAAFCALAIPLSVWLGPVGCNYGCGRQSID
jgi:hypothetical protein